MEWIGDKNLTHHGYGHADGGGDHGHDGGGRGYGDLVKPLIEVCKRVRRRDLWGYNM